MKIDPFKLYAEEYDDWFEKHSNIYESELNALREFINDGYNGIEIGSGTGRFSIPLKIPIGVEPSTEMAEIARLRGMRVVNARAEDLPFEKGIFDFTLFVTTICFLDSIGRSFMEASRITRDSGFIVIAFIDKNSTIGKLYRKKKNEILFYKKAVFYSVKQVLYYLIKAGFSDFSYRQTLGTLNDDTVHPVEEGFGKRGFVVIKGIKK